jgi:hypothetical protein
MQFRDEGAPPTDGSFEFPGVEDFIISSVVGGTGSAVGLPVNIIGKFTIDEIIDLGTGEISTVTSPSTNPNFKIHDGVSNELTGRLVFNDISTSFFNGTINALFGANLSNIQYSGTNPDLLQLKNTATNDGAVRVTFDGALLDADYTLSGLVDNEIDLTDYAGRVRSSGTPSGNTGTGLVPEPASALVWTFFALAVGAVVSFKRGLLCVSKAK